MAAEVKLEIAAMHTIVNVCGSAGVTVTRKTAIDQISKIARQVIMANVPAVEAPSVPEVPEVPTATDVAPKPKLSTATKLKKG